MELISDHGMPQALDQGTLLPLTDFNEHLNNARPGNVIRFRRHSFTHHVNVFVLADGQFMSAADDWAGQPSLTSAEGAKSQGGNLLADELALSAQCHMEKELCTRWLRDSVLRVPLRNVVTDEGTTIEPVPTLERILPHYLETDEHLYRIIAAASPDGVDWPVQLCAPVFARLGKRAVKDPEAVDSFLRLLSPAQRTILPSELLARLL